MNLRTLFPKQFAKVLKRIEAEGYEIREPSKIYQAFEDELYSFLDGFVSGHCCENEMADMIGNIISECKLEMVLTPEASYYQQVDAAMLEYS